MARVSTGIFFNQGEHLQIMALVFVLFWDGVDFGSTSSPASLLQHSLRTWARQSQTANQHFCAVLNDSVSRGANIELEINGARLAYDSEELWTAEWKRIVLTMSKGLLELGVDQGEWDWHIVSDWTKRFAAAIIAILPLEASGVYGLEVAGFPEGALTAVQMNRYERDPRNRAAAVALHGTACAGCGLELKSKYGPIAESLIEVHHVTPVSQLGAGYVIDPMHDLVPLCPNCHAVVHRQVPPLTIGELRQLLDCDFREVEVCAPREGGDSG